MLRTAEFAVQPKTGLLAGVYDEDIVATGTATGNLLLQQ